MVVCSFHIELLQGLTYVAALRNCSRKNLMFFVMALFSCAEGLSGFLLLSIDVLTSTLFYSMNQFLNKRKE